MTGEIPPDRDPPATSRSRLLVLALLVVGVFTGFASDDAAATGLAILALAGIPVVFAVPPRGRPLVGAALIVVALLVAVAGISSPDAFTWAAAIAVVAAGGLMVWRGRQWPPLGGRFAGGGDRSEQASMDLWRELDRGHDPTAPDEPPV